MLDYANTKAAIEIGVDEVGRGCLLGPVLAAAVVLPNAAAIEAHAAQWGRVKDSKKLSEKARTELSGFIRSQCIYGFGWMTAADIDRMNILRATMKGMHVALDACFRQLKETEKDRDTENEPMNEPQTVLLRIDGNHFKCYVPPGDDDDRWNIEAECVVQGDNQYLAIAAASIIAKHERDTAMLRLVEEDPRLSLYGIAKNKGYGTKVHMDALKEHGATEHHRRSFRPCSEASEAPKASETPKASEAPKQS